MTPIDRLCLTAICGAGLFCWFRYPYQMASAILVVAVLGMLVLSVQAMASGAKRVGREMKTRLPGKAPRSHNTLSTKMKVIR